MNKSIKISKKLRKEIARYAISFFFAWFVSALVSDFPFFKGIIKSIGLDELFTNQLVFLTEKLLNIIGFVTYSDGAFLKIEGTYGIRFAYGCLGFRELSFFVVFVLLQYGRFQYKFIYIVFGVVLLELLNVLRATVIAVGQYYNPNQTQLIHDVISPIIMYPTIFFLWIIWIRTYGKYHSEA